MATTTPKCFYRGAATTNSSSLYTVPSATTAIITDIIVTNTTSSAGTYTITLDGISIASGVAVPATDSIGISLKQVLATGKILAASASATTINFHISGVEIV